MEYFYAWISLIITGGLASMVPGAAFAMVLRNSTAISRDAGLMTAMGLAVGVAFHSSLILLGIGILISESETTVLVIRWLGSIYLLYVGISCLKAKKRAPGSQDDDVLTTNFDKITSFKQGLITNLANPKVIIFSLALFLNLLLLTHLSMLNAFMPPP